MNTSAFVRVSTCLFSVLGLVHLYRAVFAIPIMVGTRAVPVGLSWLACVVLFFMAYSGFRSWR